MEIKQEDIILTTKDYIMCDGTTENNADISSGHPAVYLKIPKNDNKVRCPYCNRTFLKT